MERQPGSVMNEMLTREPIRLSTRQPQQRRQEWRPWKKLGYRVLGEDGLTVHHERDAICQKVLEAFDGLDADLFLFGSQAQGTAGERSDYDIGYWATEKIPPGILASLAEQLEEWPIPSRVDLVDFSLVPDSFVKIALQGGVEIWKKRRRNSLFT